MSNVEHEELPKCSGCGQAIVFEHLIGCPAITPPKIAPNFHAWSETAHKWPYCVMCGGRFGDEIGSHEEHICTSVHGHVEFCGECGAELTDFGACLNDHSEETAYR